MERIIQFFEVTARVVDVFSLLLLVVGFLRGAVGWMAQEWRRLPWSERFRPFRRLRCVVGLHILFALELLIISDIIHTFLAVVEHHAMEGACYHSPTFNALVHLAVVVAIRVTGKIPTFRVRVKAGRVLVDPIPNPAGTKVEAAVI